MASATLYSTCTQTLMQTGEAYTQAHAWGIHREAESHAETYINWFFAINFNVLIRSRMDAHHFTVQLID